MANSKKASQIKSIHGREVLDSRGNPTIEVTVFLHNNIHGTYTTPSGASTGTREAVELRDNDKNRYHGNGVLKAVDHVHSLISPALAGKNVQDQQTIDTVLCELDGTSNKSKLGANAMIAVSCACSVAAATVHEMPVYAYLSQNLLHTESHPVHLPIPQFNVINGGAHADNNLDFQEFFIIPHKAGEKFSSLLRMGSEVFHTLGNLLKEMGLNTNVGNEGGYAPNFSSNDETLDFLMKAITKAGYKPHEDISLGLDVAASEFYKDSNYLLEQKNKLSSGDMIELYEDLIHRYPIRTIEDPLDENDWNGWKRLHKKLGSKIQIVGDDIFVTQTSYIQKGINQQAANAVLIKPNQVGTLSETLQAIEMSTKNNLSCVISHRSGETPDTYIADLAVGSDSSQIKTGAPSRGERVAKYNRLMEIEEHEPHSTVSTAFSV